MNDPLDALRLLELIDRHRQTVAALLESEGDDEAAHHERQAAIAVALAPVTDPAGIVRKLRYLCEIEGHGCDRPLIHLALAVHFPGCRNRVVLTG